MIVGDVMDVKPAVNNSKVARVPVDPVRLASYVFAQSVYARYYDADRKSGIRGLYVACFDNSTAHGYRQLSHARGKNVFRENYSLKLTSLCCPKYFK
jgi:hypothetical protein